MQSTNFLNLLKPVHFTLTVMVLSFGISGSLFGQEDSKAAEEPSRNVAIEISNEPKTVDPATLVSAQLAVPVTVKFDGDPLKKVFTWLQQDQSLNILVDYKALASVKLLDTEPVYEELNDAPLYLLLNRLERMGLAWYEQDHSLVITSREEFLKHETTTPYNLGDLFDAGYPPQELLTTLKRGSGGRWSSADGGAAVLLGDVVFIRQTDDVHREIAGLLSALRKHSRRTLTFDTPRNDVLRAALDLKVTVDFQETPLIVALQELSRQSQVSIRIDRVAILKGQVRERTPVTLKLADQKLNSVLKSILSGLGLNWYLRDEILWITSAEAAAEFSKTAVYDVRDLCLDQEESRALKLAIEHQTRAKWRGADDRTGILESPKPGVLVVRHSEPTLDEVLQLLEDYRTALKASKLRVVPLPDPQEIIMGYYRLTGPMAHDLSLRLPILISPGTWNSEGHPDGVGTILTISAESTPVDAKGNANEQVILVIEQTRETHRKIGKLIQTLLNSQAVDPEVTSDTTKSKSSQSGRFGRGLIPKTVP